MSELYGLLSFFVLVGMAVFVYFSYPKEWQKDRMFNRMLFLWHFWGTIALGLIFLSFIQVENDSLRYEITRVGTYFFLMIIFNFMFYFIRLCVQGICVLVQKKKGKKLDFSSRIFHKKHQSVVFLALSWILVTIGYFHIDYLTGTDYDVVIEKECAEKELTIAFMSDVHAGFGTYHFTYEKIAEQINEAHPDVILLGGDIFDETTTEKDVELFRKTIQEIEQPPYGIYYIYGNHDNRTDDWSGKLMQEMGIRVLEDEMAVIADDIQLIGTLDVKHRDKEPQELIEELQPDKNKPIIFLNHRPKGFQKMADSGCDLALAGHSHGFNIPFFLGSPMLGDMYQGIKKYDDMTAITTSGVSAWGFHYKFPAKAEIVFVHLRLDKNS